ncbi:YafY family protein [Alicyclobacillus sp. SO9]|uniref:helix-turn-helix transcriptional regulator n=1 Tax=Alicyclobacillus sp. SO9 TaxID=2665646 RepID=UPI0018E8FA27|nr:WYL domain-containing protein [Alicyclobacillus sp. SO9]QQE80462.1 transcriptional regulator [Alicyclobacillus sp. SO9]
MPDSTARILQTLHLINAEPKQYSAQGLAEHFGVGKRTVLRDIRVLRGLDYIIDSENRGGYYIQWDPLRLPMRLTEDERVALKLLPELALSHGSPQEVAKISREYRSAIAKIFEKLGLQRDGHETSDRLSERMLAGFNFNGMGNDGAIIALLDAVQRRSTVEMEYHSFSSDTVLTRQFDPYYILPRHNSLYALGYCHLRNEYRTFRVSRMRSVRVLDKRFVEETDFSLAEVLSTSFGVDANGEEILAVLCFDRTSVRYVKEQIENPESVVEESERDDGSVQLKISAHLNPEFVHWVLQYGADVEVLGPDNLVEEIRRHVQLQAQRYLT